jgi:hypothetical protein
MDFIVHELQILLAGIDEGGHVNATRQGFMGSGNLNRISSRHQDILLPWSVGTPAAVKHQFRVHTESRGALA